MTIRTNAKGHLRAASSDLQAGMILVVGRGTRSGSYHDEITGEDLAPGNYTIERVWSGWDEASVRRPKSQRRYGIEFTTGQQTAMVLPPARTHRILSVEEQALHDARAAEPKVEEDTAGKCANWTGLGGRNAALTVDVFGLGVYQVDDDDIVADLDRLPLTDLIAEVWEAVDDGSSHYGEIADLPRIALTAMAGEFRQGARNNEREAAARENRLKAAAEAADVCGETLLSHGRTLTCTLPPHDKDGWHDDGDGTRWEGRTWSLDDMRNEAHRLGMMPSGVSTGTDDEETLGKLNRLSHLQALRDDLTSRLAELRAERSQLINRLSDVDREAERLELAIRGKQEALDLWERGPGQLPLGF